MTTDASFGASQPSSMGVFGRGATDAAPSVLALLFGAGEQGVLYDPSNISTLFQDSAGTTPVTAAGQPVGRMLDLSGNGNHALQANASARPIYQTDGTLHWLAFNGISHSISTPTINFSATNELSILTALQPLSTGGVDMVLEMSPTADTNTGAIALLAPANSIPIRIYSKGNSGSGVNLLGGMYAAPNTHQVTSLSKISPPILTLRADGGANVISSTSTQGSGNYGNWPLYIGSRNNSSLFFQGNIYGLVVRNALTSGALLTGAETAMAAKAGLTV